MDSWPDYPDKVKISKGHVMLKRYASAKEMALMYMTQDQRGASAIEYGLIGGLIAAVLVGILQATGVNLQSIFNTINSAVDLAIEN